MDYSSRLFDKSALSGMTPGKNRSSNNRSSGNEEHDRSGSALAKSAQFKSHYNLTESESAASSAAGFGGNLLQNDMTRNSISRDGLVEEVSPKRLSQTEISLRKSK